VHILRDRLRQARSRRARHLAAADFAASIGLHKDARIEMLRVANRQADAEICANGNDGTDENDGTDGTDGMDGTVAGGGFGGCVAGMAATADSDPWYDELGITIPWLLRCVPKLPRAPEPLASPCSSGLIDGLLQAGSILCAILAAPLIAIWAAATLVYMPVAAALPLIGPALCLSRREPLPLLATVLSAGYLCVVLAGLFLVPSVRVFQRMRVQLRGAAAFPSAFYCAAVAKIIAERCEVAVQTTLAFSRRARPTPLLKCAAVPRQPQLHNFTTEYPPSLPASVIWNQFRSSARPTCSSAQLCSPTEPQLLPHPLRPPCPSQ
jgi:hypothetical protein